MAIETEVVKKEFITTEYCRSENGLEFHGGKKYFHTKTPCSSVVFFFLMNIRRQTFPIVCFGSNREFLEYMTHNIIRGEYVS